MAKLLIKEQLENMVTFLNTYFKEVHKSPYSKSFYNMDVDWGHKPIGVIRLSDHWNFKSSRDNKIHCKTKRKPKLDHVSIAVFDGSVFNVIYSLRLIDYSYEISKENQERFDVYTLNFNLYNNKFSWSLLDQEDDNSVPIFKLWGDLKNVA